MSNTLAPSRSTVYISNLPFDLKNNDLHKIFEKYGKLVKVTIVKDKTKRRSKGVAFLLYLNKEDAAKCVEATNLQEMFGRTLKASLAKDNGRSTEFIRRKNYPDKSQCYECGEKGHLSYNCSKNLLGDRPVPTKKVRKRKIKQKTEAKINLEEEEEEEIDDDETLSAAIALEQKRKELEEYQTNMENKIEMRATSSRKRIKKSSYFSDEEESD